MGDGTETAEVYAGPFDYDPREYAPENYDPDDAGGCRECGKPCEWGVDNKDRRIKMCASCYWFEDHDELPF